MIDDETPAFDIGHNSGSMLEAARADLRVAIYDDASKGKTFAERKSEFLTSASRQVVRDRETAGAAGDTVKLANEVWAMIDTARRERSDPYRAVHLALSADASEFWEPVNEAMRGLRAQVDAWTAEEDKRIADQQREQEEEMARLRTKQAPAMPVVTAEPVPARQATPIPPRPRSAAPAMLPPRRSKIRGDLGAVISAKDATTYEIEDFDLLPDYILKSRTVVEAILAVVKATAKTVGVPPGIRTVTTTGNQIR